MAKNYRTCYNWNFIDGSLKYSLSTIYRQPIREPKLLLHPTLLFDFAGANIQIIFDGWRFPLLAGYHHVGAGGGQGPPRIVCDLL
ncbi:MAG: hypothetical protein IJT61_02925 [Bacteroidales bacterium]|nr:hypothetical protein [Bacteroidales bacterium]